MVIVDNEKKLQFSFEKMYAMDDRFICRPTKHYNINAKGIIIPDKVKSDEFISLIVLKRGPAVKNEFIFPGDIVFIRAVAGVFMGTKQDSEKHFVNIRESEILSYIKREDVEEISNPTEEERSLDEELSAKIKPIADA